MMSWNCSRNYTSKVGVETFEVSSCCCDHVKCEEPKKQFNFCKGVFKVTIVFLSFAGFLYQATDICTHYFSYRTVVYTNTEQDSVIDLPAVTFCLPTYFSKRSLIDLYDDHIKKSLQEVQQQFGNNETILSNMKTFIFQSYQNQAFKDLPVSELLNQTIKIDEILECRLYYPPITWLNLTNNKIFEIMQYGIPCQDVSYSVVESINANGKCFTYFSQLDGSDQIDVNSYRISVNRGFRYHAGRFLKLLVHFAQDEYASVPDGQKRECLQVHPPYKIPSEACLHAINPGMSYDFVLVKTKAILQPPPYQTNCRSYQSLSDSHHKKGLNYPKSRSDCIDICMLKFYEKNCNCLPIHLTIWANISANLNLSICNYDDFNSISDCVKTEMSNYCYDNCKPDCIDRHYHLQVESRVFPTQAQIDNTIGNEKDNLIKMRINSAVINIWSDYQSDVTYIHTPSMSLIQLVCYLGGLAGDDIDLIID